MHAQTGALAALRADLAPIARRSERALVRAARGGSAQAMEELFRRYWQPSHRAAYLVVHDAAGAEDIVQEAFIAAIRALDRFDRRRPFGPWLHRIVVNRSIDWARARGARREIADPQSVPEAVAPESDPAARADRERVVTALAKLPPEQRAAIVMRYLLGYTPGEIAAALELPRGTVNSRLRRGLDALAELLPREEAG